MLTIAEIKKIASLAKLAISEQEAKILANDVPSILNYVSQLQVLKLDSEDQVDSEAKENNLRMDEVVGESSATTQAIIDCAPTVENRLIKTKPVF